MCPRSKSNQSLETSRMCSVLGGTRKHLNFCELRNCHQATAGGGVCHLGDLVRVTPVGTVHRWQINAHCFWEASDYKKTVHTCISANFTSCIYQTRTIIASCRGPLLAPTDQSALTTRGRSHVCLEISYLISSRGIIITTSPSAWKYGVITCTNVVSDPANCTTRDQDDAGMGRPICM